MNGTNDDLPVARLNNVQALLLPQIERAMASMHHIDESFQWLAHLLIQYFNIPLLLTWASRTDEYGQSVAQLRTIARQDPTFPEQIVVNDQMQHLAQQLLVRRLTYQPQPLDTLFSHYQTLLFKRYGLHYWGACFLSKNVLLPARRGVFMRDDTPTFLATVTLFFLTHLPRVNPVQPMGLVLDKVMEAAFARGLLLPAPEPQVSFPSSAPLTPFPLPEDKWPLQQKRPQLAQLVPGRKHDANLLLSDNPFTQAGVIPDKKARRLYTAINGQDTVAELCSGTGMNLQEISAALRVLWDLGRIEARDLDGHPADLLLFLNDR